MPSPIFNVAQLHQAIQYTGSNSADLDAAIPDFTIVTESGGNLTFNSFSNNHTCNTSDWVIWDVGGIQVLTNTNYNAEWDCLTLCSETATVATTIADAAAGKIRAVGVAPVPLLLLGASTTVAVQLQPAMPDSTYTAYVHKFAGVSITDLQINSVTVVDADTVNVAVQNVGLATITGATVMVHAID